MFLTSYFLKEGNNKKKQIAAIKQRWEDKYPNKYVSNQGCASDIFADVQVCHSLASKIYKTAHGTLARDESDLIVPEIRSWFGTAKTALPIVRYIDTLTQGKYDGTPIQKFVEANEPDTFDFDGEHLTFDEIVDAVVVAQDIALISLYIAEPLNLNYRQKQLDLPNPDFVKVFINNGGNEFVDALYNGCAVEDIVSQ